jgi:hypothetical protein
MMIGWIKALFSKIPAHAKYLFQTGIQTCSHLTTQNQIMQRYITIAMQNITKYYEIAAITLL